MTRRRWALVTGGSRGIGLATVRRLRQDGWRVASVDTLPSPLDDRDVEATLADVRDREAVDAATQAWIGRWGPPGAVISNAGVGLAGAFTRAPADDFDRVVQINLIGAANVVRATLPAMLDAGAGSVVFVVSALGYFPAPGLSAYVASKHGLLGLSHSLRAEVAARGVRVSAVCPGVVATPLIDEAPIYSSDPGLSGRVRGLFRRRAIPPDRVARAIVGALDRDAPVIPVGIEARVLWALRHLPAATFGIAGGLLRKARRT